MRQTKEISFIHLFRQIRADQIIPDHSIVDMTVMRGHAWLACLALSIAILTFQLSVSVSATPLLAGATLRGSYNHPGVKAFYLFEQLNDGSNNVRINITISGLSSGTYATHIHEFGDVTTGINSTHPDIDISANGAGVGTHFNPTNQSHNCAPNARHVGDIGNITVSGSSEQHLSIMSDILSLNVSSIASIIGRAIIIHDGPDDCKPPTGHAGSAVAQGVIGIVEPSRYGVVGENEDAGVGLAKQPKSAIALLHATSASGLATSLNGTVQFGYNSTTGLIRVVATICCVEPKATHAIHIHAWGDESSSDGTAAGGHYNPFDAPHALPPTHNRHMGDLGNIQADSSGSLVLDEQFDLVRLIPANVSSTANILGRAVVLHGGVDDGVSQPSGAAGPRIAVGTIGISNQKMPPAKGNTATHQTAISALTTLVTILACIVNRRYTL